MQFVRSGPDVPEMLLQAHEEGRVIFFCGAGISYPAGLPGFGKLVDDVYLALHTKPQDGEVKAYRDKRFDAALELLERRIPGGRIALRKVVSDILHPKRWPKGATSTQAALLQLARDRTGSTRLVTTNFDRLFQGLMDRTQPRIQGFAAPLLPIPKSSKWNGVVYLHGLLPKVQDESSLNRLVLSSGDFGLAYLTERWAARFVSELFRNFIVCFVGYSIDDPVLRYMMDALAADRVLGESTPQAYAFGGFQSGSQEEAKTEWQSKGVVPILYEVSPATHDHSVLHKTLAAWADTYRDGVTGKEALVAMYAVNPPGGSTLEENFAGRIIWAICDRTSLPARRFAELDPVPPLDWLDELDARRFKHADLPQFGVAPNAQVDEALVYSVLERPTPYSVAPRMSLLAVTGWTFGWDAVMDQLARWLARHLDDPKLVLWIARHGGRVDRQWSRVIAERLDRIDKLVADGKQAELTSMRVSAPRAIPRPAMRALWRVVLSGRLNSHREHFDSIGWVKRSKVEGLTTTLRIELREMLTPRIEISQPFGFDDDLDDEKRTGISTRSPVEWELVLAVKHPRELLTEHFQKSPWKEFLPALLPDFELLLLDALGLKRELGGADDTSDNSYSDQPSIAEHPQNRRFHDWTVLIELTRDAWLATVELDPARAKVVADQWWRTPYPTFKRLALFAAAKAPNVVWPERVIEWLLSENARWLWSDEVRREVIRVLVEVGPLLGKLAMARLQRTILKGPPRSLYRDDLTVGRWRTVRQHGIWLLLIKMTSAGLRPTAATTAFLEAIKRKHPNWRLARDDRDEFAFWMGTGTWDDDEDQEGGVTSERETPKSRVEIVEWLKKPPTTGRGRSDDWRKRCSDDFETTAGALADLASEGLWPENRWHEALQTWSEDKLAAASWRTMAPTVAKAPDELVSAVARGLSSWLKAVANSFEGHEELFVELAHRVLAMSEPGELPAEDPVGRALNHPVGQVTDAFMRWWYRQGLLDAQGLSPEFGLLFTSIANRDIAKYRHGRVFLAANAVALFRVDRAWAETNLLPLFDWSLSEVEARSAWKGFLWTPRLYWPFLAAIKMPFLETANRYGVLGDHARQYADLLTFGALDEADTISRDEFAEATAMLPGEGLDHAAHTVARALAGSSDQRESYWRHRVLPYLQGVWPMDLERKSLQIADGMARLALASGNAFPEALEVVQYWLMPLESGDYPVHLLHESNLSKVFPKEALTLLNAIVDVNAPWVPSDLRSCLDAIVGTKPALKSDPRYRALDAFGRRLGSS